MTANVVRLPTAAPRQVKNSRYAAQTYAAVALREAQPWPGEYKLPWERRRDAEKAARPSIEHIERTPAMVMAIAVFGALTENQRAVAMAGARLADCVKQSGATRDALLMMEAMIGVRQTAETLVAATEAGL